MKELFNLPDDLHYLNWAYMSPLLNQVKQAGFEGIEFKTNPSLTSSVDFFTKTDILRKKFGQLIGAAHTQTAIIPSSSYGLASVINNIPNRKRKKCIILSNEFPSGYYALARWCKENNHVIKVIEAPISQKNREKNWNQSLINELDEQVEMAVLSIVDWSDGTAFNLEEISKICRDKSIHLIIDGTQSIGALPINVNELGIDALICGAYKWMMGPYGIGMAYYSEKFNNGIPLEESWLNRHNAQDFTSLTQYTEEYFEGARRYEVGQSPNFILVPMYIAAIDQLLEWGQSKIQQHCFKNLEPLKNFLKSKVNLEIDDSRSSHHIFGFPISDKFDENKLGVELKDNKVFLSKRTGNLRISSHLLNDEKDFEALIYCLENSIKK